MEDTFPNFMKNIACINYQGKLLVGESKGHPYWHAEIDIVMKVLIKVGRITEQQCIALYCKTLPLKPKKGEDERIFYSSNREFLQIKKERDDILRQYSSVKTSNVVYTERYPCSNCMEVLNQLLGESGEIHYTVSMLGKTQEQVAHELQENYEEIKREIDSASATYLDSLADSQPLVDTELPSASLVVPASLFLPVSTAASLPLPEVVVDPAADLDPALPKNNPAP